MRWTTTILLMVKKRNFLLQKLLTNFFLNLIQSTGPKRKAIEKLNQDTIEYDSDILKATIKKILDDWEKKRNDAALKGTLLT